MLKPCSSFSYFALAACLLVSGVALADNAAPDASASAANVTSNISNNPMNASYLAQLVVGLMVVILCIVALAWFARRFGRLQTSSDGSLQMLGGMSMGARERIVLVQVGDKQLLLGVAPGRINTLHVLDEPLASSRECSTTVPAGSFAEKLGAMLSQGKS